MSTNSSDSKPNTTTEHRIPDIIGKRARYIKYVPSTEGGLEDMTPLIGKTGVLESIYADGRDDGQLYLFLTDEGHRHTVFREEIELLSHI